MDASVWVHAIMLPVWCVLMLLSRRAMRKAERLHAEWIEEMRNGPHS